LPPKDPENEDTLLPDLMIKKDWLIAALEKTLEVVMDWLLDE